MTYDPQSAPEHSKKTPVWFKFIAIVWAVAMILMLAMPMIASASEAAPAAVSRDARCPVCGMYAARFPKWMAQARLPDGKVVVFDAPSDMFRFLTTPEKYDHNAVEISNSALWVSDHANKGWLNAREAFYVRGSDIKGPMRQPDLPAFRNQVEADAAVAEHGGQVLRFKDINASLIDQLPNAGHSGHGH